MKAYLVMGSLSGMVDIDYIMPAIFLPVNEAIKVIDYSTEPCDETNMKTLKFDYKGRLSDNVIQYDFNSIF